jgi:UDP:flavonoid glycosyltransferase YjiC (YdhE family)
MRFLFVTWAWPTHLMAMVPLARACLEGGHEVLVASQPALSGAIADVGLAAASVGQDVDSITAFREIALPPTSARPGPARPGAGGPGPGGPRVLRLLVSLAEAMADDLIALAQGWQADLIVFEPTALAGSVAAAAVGLPAVRHLYGTDLMSGMREFLPAALASLGGRLGVPAADPMGAATIDPCPAGVQAPVGSRRLPVRYVPVSGPGLVPQRLPARGHRPRVCVTWGTTLSRIDPGLFGAGRVLHALAGLDVEVVCAITAEQRAALGPVPDGVRVIESAPLHLLLPDCDLVVAHGGAATLLTALSHGLPQLHIPFLPDHKRHAAQLAAAGAGALLPAPADDPRQIRDQVSRLLAGPGFRTAARRLRDEMLRQPEPARLVPELELLAAQASSRA